MKDEQLRNAFVLVRRELTVDCYICHILDGLYYNKRINSATRNKAKKLITTRLNHCESLQTWLGAFHNIQYAWDNPWKLLRTREAWVDSLIEEFS
jgi:hypothetical protein